MTDSFRFFELPNGIRAVSLPSGSGVAHLAVYVNAGSRDESAAEHGIAHLIEHTAFKGTRNRKAYHILSRLDDVGGDLNAFTTKEHTCLHASFLEEHTERAMELFSDILLNATFPDKEIEKEKLVIMDEINSFKDSPSEAIFDDFEELIFTGHPMARNILGTPDSIKKLNRTSILRFISKHFSAPNTAIAFIGNLPSERFSGLVKKYFSGMKNNVCLRSREPFSGYKPQCLSLEKDTYQTHIITGNLAYPTGHPKKLTLQLLNNILGGPASSSRLNMALRERNASAYHVESNYQPYSDTGYLSVYMGITSAETEKVLNILWKELDKLRNQPLGTLQLHRARLQVAGQVALWHESKLNEMLWMGRKHLYGQIPEPVESTIRAVGKITASDLMEAAQEIFVKEHFSTLVYLAKPEEDE